MNATRPGVAGALLATWLASVSLVASCAGPQGAAPAAVEPPTTAVPAVSTEPPAPMVEPVDEHPRQEVAASDRDDPSGVAPRFGALGRCVLTGKVSQGAIRVDPPGLAPLSLGLVAASTTVTFGLGEGAAARVAHAGSIRFEASAHDLVLTLTKPVSRHDGMVRAPKGARLSAGHELADGQVRVLTSIGIPIDVPCDHLALGGRKPPEKSVLQRAPVFEAVDQQPLLLAASRSAVPTLRLPGEMMFTRRGGGVDFVEIVHRGWDGVTVSGWLPQARLQAGSEGQSLSGISECGCGGPDDPVGKRDPRDPFHGPAKLREGAAIHTARGGAIWARGIANGPVTVSWGGQDDPWVEIRIIPGVDDAYDEDQCHCSHVSHAFVARSGVEF